jgi:hypothetical protein
MSQENSYDASSEHLRGAETRDRTKSASSPEVFTISRDFFNLIIVAGVFLIVGILIGINLKGDNSISRAEMATLVQNAVANEMANFEESLVSATSGDINTDQLQELVQNAVADAVANNDGSGV